jgi:hypothetical protein
MAKMYPKELPGNIRGNPLRAAECKVYDELEKQLEDTFHVFYSSPWLGTTEYGEEKDGEADFTIAHVDHGMLVVEVKGGRVHIEDDTHQWHSVDRNGIDHKIKDPVNQARLGKHNLLKALKERSELALPYINARHGVILTDVKRAGHALGADMPLKIFAFSEDINHLDSWVLSRYGCREDEKYPENINPLGLPGVMALKSLLSDGVQLRIDLRAYLDSDVKRIEVLSEEQYGILKELDENPRMAIAGAAGTGKTVLAAHKAVLEAEDDKPTLLVCFNEPLALHLRSRLSDRAGIDVFSFHRLCEDVARKAHIPLPPANERNADFFKRQLPNLFVSGLSSLPNRRYAAIVVDEGQDFEDSWLENLELALTEDEIAAFYIFYDNNQQVMNRASNYIRSMNAARRRLRSNFRNTRKIFEVASRFYAGDGVISVGPIGEPVKVIEANGESAAMTKLRETLGFLIAETSIRSERVAVLCDSRGKANEIGAGGKIGAYQITDASHPAVGSVVLDSVRRFKGLEADVIILFLPDTYVDDAEMLYVATTRAKGMLIIIGSEGANSIIQP